ncbi:MAG: lytic murein transglycosylase, partial [Alphaproteobacteria bacterium]
MRLSLRLLLIGTVAACAPMLPEAPPLPGSAPAPAQPTPSTPTPAPAPVQPPAADAADLAGFEGWKQGFLARHGGVRRAAYEREL